MAHKFKIPFNALVCGASQSGKTTWVKKFLSNLNDMLDKEIFEVIFCYGIAQKTHQELKQLVSVPFRLIEGLPQLDEISSENSPPKLVIIDDLINQIDKSTADLFLRGSHHRNISLCLLSQNLFSANKQFREISINSHYIIVFSSPREKGQILAFSRQVEPNKVKFLMEAYQNATQISYGYMLFDLKQNTDPLLRYSTRIFPDERTIYYVPKN
jgi:Poxvirus A32 protein